MGLAHFQRNTGPWGLVRAVAILGLFLAMAVTMLVNEGSWLPLGAFAIAGAAPILLRAWMVDHFDRMLAPLKYFGFALVGGAATSGLWKDHVPERLVSGEAFFTAITFLATLYMSAWVCLMAHPLITTARGRGE